MPWTKEERKAYNKEYNEKNKERRKAKMKEYNQTPAGIKLNRIRRWKWQGIIVPDNNYDKFYDERFITTSHCELCQKELTEDKRNTHSTRCPHHDHNILDKPNVIAICCQACNLNYKSTNTSGEPNISYCKTHKLWRFEKIIQGKRYTKTGFKTKEEAINYKKDFLASPIFG